MGHIDENINGTYCEMCKRRVAINEKYCGVSYICDSCRVGIEALARGLNRLLLQKYGTQPERQLREYW